MHALPIVTPVALDQEPGRQLMHLDAPSGDQTPAPQVMQEATLVAAGLVVYVPASQLWQVSATVAPITEDHLPAPHGVQALFVLAP